MGFGGSLTSLRASSSAQHGYVAASVPAGTGGDGIFASDASADAESLLSTLPAGLGASMTGDLDTRKFRRDKLSRIFRLQRGTRCFRFTLLFLAVSGALAPPTWGVSPCQCLLVRSLERARSRSRVRYRDHCRTGPTFAPTHSGTGNSRSPHAS